MNRRDLPFLVLDANILIRAVLGKRVRDIILGYHKQARFFAPDVAYVDARKYLPPLLLKRGLPSDDVLVLLDQLENIVSPITLEVYGHLRRQALQRIAARDEDDWPVVAVALALDCAIWTEDQDFFGTGVATWTTDRVELYLSSAGGCS
ncbi:MAG: PIN domain-containing protein [Lautropia sp.]|nr:PIN domain-containing protein [Lautropia sp.]